MIKLTITHCAGLNKNNPIAGQRAGLIVIINTKKSKEIKTDQKIHTERCWRALI